MYPSKNNKGDEAILDSGHVLPGLVTYRGNLGTRGLVYLYAFIFISLIAYLSFILVRAYAFVVYAY